MLFMSSLNVAKSLAPMVNEQHAGQSPKSSGLPELASAVLNPLTTQVESSGGH